jgi:hypothetical protein
MRALIVLLALLALSFNYSQSSQKELINNLPPKIKSVNQDLFVFVSINKDNFLDIAIIENDKLNVYLNLGNGKIADEPLVSYTLKQGAVKLTNYPDSNSKVNVIYSNGSSAEIDLTIICCNNKQTENIFDKPTTDSISFEPVWNYTLTENTGGWGMTAGDIDNDGKVEVIASMTDPDSVINGWILIFENDGDNSYSIDTIIHLNVHTWIDVIKITDWDQDGNKELTIMYNFEAHIYEFYGDNNYKYFNTNIYYSGFGGCSGLEIVDTDNDGKLELVTMFVDDNPRITRLELYEFIHKDTTIQNYFIFNLIAARNFSGILYSFAAGDMDNDGLLDILPGYAQFWPPSPNELFYIEYDPVKNIFINKSFQHPYPIDPAFCLIDDLDGDGFNEVLITGVGGGYGGMIYMKSTAPDNYQILGVDSILYNSAGSTIKTTIINNRKYPIKAAAFVDLTNGLFIYFISIINILNNELTNVWGKPFHEFETYVHSFEILDTDKDQKENIVYLISCCIRRLFDWERTITVGVNEGESNIYDFEILQNYPNPFNRQTVISFTVPSDTKITMRIYDILGRTLKTYNIDCIKGNNSMVWDGQNDLGNDVSTGTYFYQIIYSNQIYTKKMILLR